MTTSILTLVGLAIFLVVARGRLLASAAREASLLREANNELAAENQILRMSRQQFELVLENINQGVCFFTGDAKILLANRRYAEIYGLSPASIYSGQSLAEIVDLRLAAGSTPNVPRSDYLIWRSQIAATMEPSVTIVNLINGRTISIQHRPMSDGGWVATHEDITQKVQAEADIIFMAQHDMLTRLPNRTLFHDRLAQAVAMVGRGTSCAAFCLDLDHFKQINDTLGHPTGDGLLRAAADRLQRCVREQDTVARLGGDEFAIVQVGIESPEAAEALAQRLIAAFRPPFIIEEHCIAVGISIGVAVAPEDGTSPDLLLKNADVALYLAKSEGRETARFFEPEMDARLHHRRQLELDLRRALAENEFELFYQPLITSLSRRVSGFEALIRWHHPIQGLIGPREFLSLAEETGLIVEIGDWVIRTACLEATLWPSDIRVTVNLSPIQLKKGDLIEKVRAALSAANLHPARLELEITETVLLHSSGSILGALHRLRTLGVSIALDGFGKEYSSLGYLRDFPFSRIKIDQSFVQDMAGSEDAVSIVRAITSLGKSLRMETTAEGVETHEQMDMLRAEGCTEMQGYVLSKPRPARELRSIIQRLQESPHLGCDDGAYDSVGQVRIAGRSAQEAMSPASECRYRRGRDKEEGDGLRQSVPWP